jgi:hypothetical protein
VLASNDPLELELARYIYYGSVKASDQINWNKSFGGFLQLPPMVRGWKYLPTWETIGTDPTLPVMKIEAMTPDYGVIIYRSRSKRFGQVPVCVFEYNPETKEVEKRQSSLVPEWQPAYIASIGCIDWETIWKIAAPVALVVVVPEAIGYAPEVYAAMEIFYEAAKTFPVYSVP